MKDYETEIVAMEAALRGLPSDLADFLSRLLIAPQRAAWETEKARREAGQGCWD